MSRILLDAMGGDHAPQAILDGALSAIPHLKRELVLIGDEKIIKKHKIAKHVKIIHAPETIEMADKIKSIRAKPQAPINVGTRIAFESWQAYQAGSGTPDAFLSAGHSGAMMASSLLTLGRLKNVERPAIATELPTRNGQGVVILDVGANVDCKPNHLRDFAIMGAFYSASRAKGAKLPKIGILSNGEEKSKGTELTRAAYALLESMGPNPIGEFMGYTESKEMFSGEVDVVVTDGFVGNLILKNSEALASTIVGMYKAQMKSGPFSFLGALLSLHGLKTLRKRLDYRETGSAPLLGVAGYAFISHGRSDRHAIKNALIRVEEAMDAKMVERLETAMSQLT